MTRYLSNPLCLADVLCIGSSSTQQLWNDYAQNNLATPYLRPSSCTGGVDGAVASFLGNACDAPYSCCFTDDLSTLRDAGAASLLAQLPAGKRIVAVLNTSERGASAGRPSLADLSRLWQAEYYAMCCCSAFELFEGL